MHTTPSAEERVRAHARACVRSGLMSAEEMHDDLAELISTDLPEHAEDADGLASTWLAEAHDELRADQRDWPESTDYERLQSAFAEMELLDVSVLQGCEDDAAPRELVAEADARGAGLRGVVWFTPADVWRAVEEGLLPITLWHGSTATAVAPAVEGDDLAYDVLGILEKHGLRAVHQDRVVVDAQWQKPIA